MDYVGTAADESILGTAGNDSIWAGSGNDTIDGNGGNDSIYGDEGNDTVVVFSGNSEIDLSNGNDIVSVSGGSNQIDFGAGDDFIYIANGVNIVNMGYGAETVSISGGYNTVIDTNDSSISSSTVIAITGGSNIINTSEAYALNYTTYVIGASNLQNNPQDVWYGYYQNAQWHIDNPWAGSNTTIYLSQFTGNNLIYVIEKVSDFKFFDRGDHIEQFHLISSTSINYYGSGYLLLNGENYFMPGDEVIYRTNNLADNAITGTNNSENLNFTTSTRIAGQGGNDTYTGSTSADTLFGDGGNDRLSGGDGNDVLVGGNDNDSLSGNNNDDLLYGGAHNDTIKGGAGNDTIYGSWGGDSVYGDDGNDLIINSQGNDGIQTGNGDNTVQGCADSETIWCGTGNDIIYGNDAIFDISPSYLTTNYAYPDKRITFYYAEDDFSPFGETGDYIYGGIGTQTVYASDGWNRISVSGGDDTVYGGSAGDTISGGDGNDLLWGVRGDLGTEFAQIGPDTISGGNGDDTIYAIGEAINTFNSVSGGAGNDTIIINGVNAGNIMSGGSGTDTFVIDFNHVPVYGANNWCQILDFNPTAGDHIRLDSYGHFTPDITGETNIFDDPSGLRIRLGTWSGYEFDIFLAGKTTSQFTSDWFTITY